MDNHIAIHEEQLGGGGGGITTEKEAEEIRKKSQMSVTIKPNGDPVIIHYDLPTNKSDAKE